MKSNGTQRFPSVVPLPCSNTIVLKDGSYSPHQGEGVSVLVTLFPKVYNPDIANYSTEN